MKRRHLIIGLALVAALSVAVPAFGTAVPSSVQRVFGIAKKADKRSKKAAKDARRALRKAKQGEQGRTGPQGGPGPQGEPGSQGAPGATGSPGLSGVEQVFAVSPTDSESGKVVSVQCPAGKKVIGTGGEVSGGKTGNPPDQQSRVNLDDIRASSPTHVEVSAYEDGNYAGTWNVTAQAICANVG